MTPNTQTSGQGTSGKPTRVRWFIFSLAFATSALLYWHRYVFAYIKPMVAEEWGLSNTELGQIDSAFALTYSLCQFPLAIAADFCGVHVVLTGLIVCWCIGLQMFAWAPSARWMWYAQATLGAGQSAVYACLSRVSRDWYPHSIRTTLQGAVGVMAGRLGALSSSLIFMTVLLGLIELDWRTAIGVLVAVGCVHTLIFAAVFRNTPRQHPRVNEAEARLIEGSVSATAGASKQAAPTLTQTLRSMSPRSLLNLFFVALQSILSTFADNLYSNWLPLFLSQVHHLEFKQMGIYSAMPLLGGAIAGFVGGYLNDRCLKLTKNQRWSRAGVALVGKGLAGVLMFVSLLFYDDPYLFCICLFFVKFFGDWSLTSMLGVVTDIGGRATASVFALINAVAGVGLFAAPLVFGFLADQYGWWPVFVAVGTTYLLCALSWLVIDCTRPLVDEWKD